MFCTRADLETRESQWLAPYAQQSRNGRGRRHPEYGDKHRELRTPYQRDRDRVIHSRAFRRLEYKTQVFLNGTGDHLRTRLTHSMEVAGIARNIARALRLNEDLAEAIALAHDLGHPPFGHKGEEILHELMRADGGFDHNHQSLRIVEWLEQKYPDFSGLNLTWESREGLMKHQAGLEPPAELDGTAVRALSLEAQVANLADEITYYSHDLDDGLEAGLLTEADLRRDLSLWHRAEDRVHAEHGDLPDECRQYFIIRCLIDTQVRDVVEHSSSNIDKAGVQSAEKVRAWGRPLVCYSEERAAENRQLRAYLYRNLYYNPDVRGPNDRAGELLRELFAFYLEHPEEIGAQARRRMEPDGLKRCLCDYLSGMTDRYVMLEYQRLIGKAGPPRGAPAV